jgi:hypothetical protein
MKILLLGTPRSGSTSLVRLINSHINLPNYKMVIEPFNNSLYFDGNNTIETLLQYENILVKNLFLVGNDEYPKESFDNVYEYFNWCYSYFDKILILDRKDKTTQSESFVINETMWREKGVDWHTQKIYNIETIEPVYLNTMVDRYTESSQILNNISKEENLPLFYYEDIFLEKSRKHIDELFSYLDIELNESNYMEYILSPHRRVRIDKNKQNLI